MSSAKRTAGAEGPVGSSSSSNRPVKVARKAAPEYTYISLLEAAHRMRSGEGTDLMEGVTKTKTSKEDLVHCYGVVVSFTAPKAMPKGKASKYMASYFLADPSMPYSVVTNVCLNVFADSLDQLPVVQAAGDIIRCHRVKINEWNGLQLVGTLKQAKKGHFSNAAFVTFHAKFDPATGLHPLPKSAAAAAASSGSGQAKAAEEKEKARVKVRKATSGISRRVSPARLVGCLDHDLWDVHSSSPTFAFHEESELPRLQDYRSWAANMLSTTLLRDKIVDTVSLAKVRGVLAAASHGRTTVPKTLDVVCMFVCVQHQRAQEGDPAKPAPPLLLVWDGSTDGLLSVSSFQAARLSVIAKPAAVGAAHPYTPEEAILSMNAALHASNIFSSCSGLSEVEAMRERICNFSATEMSGVLPGEPVGLEMLNDALVEVAEQIVPGSWLRLRSLKIPYIPPPQQGKGLRVLAKIQQDTHVVVLPPYANDPSQLACELDMKLRKAGAAMNQNGGGAGAPCAPNAPHQQQRLVPAPRQMAGALGEELTNVAVMLSTPAPAKFCVRACICSYYPRSAEDFTMDSALFYARRDRCTGGGEQTLPTPTKYTTANVIANSDGTPASEADEEAAAAAKANHALEMITSGMGNGSREFLFSVRVADDMGETDVILSGKDAELFLGGVTADEFHAEVLAEREVKDEAKEAAAAAAAAGEAQVLDSEGNPVVFDTNAGATADAKPRKLRGLVQRLQARLDALVHARKTWHAQSMKKRDDAIFQMYLRSYTDNVGMQTVSVPSSSSISPAGKAKALPTAYKRFAVFNTRLNM